MTRRGAPRNTLLALVLLAVACRDASPPPAVGTLARDRLDLVADSFEPIVARPVEEGAFVDAGTVLVELDPTRQRARVARAREARARAKARVAELVRGPRAERIAEARARLRGAEGRLRTTEQNLSRTESLIAERVVSHERLDQQRALFDEALASRDTAQATLEELLRGTTEEELAQAHAALAESDALLAEERARLDRLQVRAPVAGWVDALPFEIGEQPPAGGVVAVLLADDVPYARVYVPATVRAHVQPGTTALVHIDGVEPPFPGRVRTVARDASFTPYFALTERDRGRLVYLAKIDLAEDARRLPSGVPLQVDFEIGSGESR